MMQNAVYTGVSQRDTWDSRAPNPLKTMTDVNAQGEICLFPLLATQNESASFVSRDTTWCGSWREAGSQLPVQKQR